MEFDPANKIVKLCLQGMSMDCNGDAFENGFGRATDR